MSFSIVPVTSCQDEMKRRYEAQNRRIAISEKYSESVATYTKLQLRSSSQFSCHAWLLPSPAKSSLLLSGKVVQNDRPDSSGASSTIGTHLVDSIRAAMISVLNTRPWFGLVRGLVSGNRERR